MMVLGCGLLEAESSCADDHKLAVTVAADALDNASPEKFLARIFRTATCLEDHAGSTSNARSQC
ncbi:hypothetical protein MMARE11_25880 [Mycobacterium marinum E11]|nr:hypothetical protein MMARE11_25880 [Mycobacterium marinum E11]